MLLSIARGSDMYLLYLSDVLLPSSILSMNLTYLPRILRFLRLCASLDGTAFGNVPLMSRNKTAVTLPILYASLILYVRTCSTSVVVHPGLLPKCLNSSSLCFSVRCVIWLATIAVRTFHIMLSRAIGLYAFETS